MTRCSFVGVLGLLVLTLLVPRAALAEDVAAAKEHYKRGTTLFDLRKYREAAQEYEKAFEAKDDPALLFNIGQAYRFAGDYDVAISTYRSYLRRVPAARNRTEVEARIVEMQRLADERKANEAKPPVDTIAPAVAAKTTEPGVISEPQSTPVVVATEPRRDTPSSRRTKTKKIAGLAVAGLGVAMLGAGIGLGVAAKGESDDITNGTKFDPATESRGKTFNSAGIALMAIGGVAIVAGAVVAALGFKESKRARLAVLPSVGDCYVGLTAAAAF